MNLLDYTKKLAEKIKLYDSLARNPFSQIINPFAKPVEITVIWVEDNYEN